MSVLIKGMEMPKHCLECLFYRAVGAGYLFHDWCVLDRSITPKVYVPDNCPLIPVPPHGDLIDRDALEQDAQKRLLMCNTNDNQFQKPYEIMRAIALAPTIIPAEKGEE